MAKNNLYNESCQEDTDSKTKHDIHDMGKNCHINLFALLSLKPLAIKKYNTKKSTAFVIDNYSQLSTILTTVDLFKCFQPNVHDLIDILLEITVQTDKIKQPVV